MTTQAATLGSVTTWQVDPAHTHVEFAVKHLMIATVRGRFSDVTGTVIVPDGDFSRAQVEATVNVASVDTREPQRDAHLKSPDFFEADKYPTMTFRSRRVENASRDTNQSARAPTMGPSSAPPTMAGMCKIVARPETLGTGIKPSWVAPRKIAIPPSIPAITICLTLRLKTESP